MQGKIRELFWVNNSFKKYIKKNILYFKNYFLRRFTRTQVSTFGFNNYIKKNINHRFIRKKT
jgi:hypothetical protein